MPPLRQAVGGAGLLVLSLSGCAGLGSLELEAPGLTELDLGGSRG